MSMFELFDDCDDISHGEHYNEIQELKNKYDGRIFKLNRAIQRAIAENEEIARQYHATASEAYRLGNKEDADMFRAMVTALYEANDVIRKHLKEVKQS